MKPYYHFKAYHRPHKPRNDDNTHHSESDIDDESWTSNSSSITTTSSDEQEWQWPDQQLLKEKMTQNNFVSRKDKISQTAKEAWLPLINHKKCSGTAEWAPGNNAVEFLLFTLFIDITNGITREILQHIIDLLWTLQQHGIVIPMKLPTKAQQIEQLADSVPKPSISLVLTFVSLHNFHLSFNVLICLLLKV